MQFKELKQQYLDSLQKQGRSISTIKNYSIDLNCFESFLTLKNLTLFRKQETLDAYAEYLSEQYPSINSRRRKLSTLRLALQFTGDSGDNSHPISVQITPPKSGKELLAPANFAEIKTVWSLLTLSMSSKNEHEALLARRNQIILLLIFGAGLKTQELSQLKTNCFTGKLLSEVVIHRGTKQERTVPLPTYFSEIYLTYEKEYKKVATDFLNKESSLLFHTTGHRVIKNGLTPRGIELVFESWRKELLITMTPRSLRQACIYLWLHKKKGEHEIKKWLGLSPHHSLKDYKKTQLNHLYSDEFITSIYNHSRVK